MMIILLSHLILFPAAILCFLPVKANLKYSFARTIAVLLPALSALIVLSSFLTWQFSLGQNSLLFPVLLICFLAYHFSLRLPLVKTLGVFNVVLALFAILSNFAACIDDFRNPGSGLGTFTSTFSLVQLGITALAILLLAYPFTKFGGFIVEQPISSVVWQALILFSAVLIVANIAILPAEYFLFHEQMSIINVLLILSTLLIIWASMLVILYFAISSMLTFNEMKEKNRIFEMQESQLRSMQEYIKASERTRHDFRHNILTLAALYNDGKIEELGDYLHEYVEKMPKREHVAYCDNTALNAMLNYYVHVAALNQIDFTLRVNIPQKLPVSDVDLCTMVSNILENAVIACQSAEGKIMQLSIIVENRSQLFIVAVNSFNGVVCQKDGRYLSSNSGGKGIGLSSVVSTAENYGGTAQFSHEGKRFFSNIAIPLED